jgi:hypothetical protein
VMPAAAGDAAKQAMPVSDDERRLLESLSRFALVKRAVAAQAPAFLDALDERFAVEIMTFGSRLEAVRAAPADGRTGEDDRPALRRAFADLDAPDGEITPIGAALRGLLERLRGQPLAGVILLTDGANNAGEDVVFKDDLMPLTVRIRSTGCVGRKVTLVLSAGEGPNERVLKVKPDVVITGDGVQTEEIQFVPEHDGRMQLNVRIEPLPDEQNQANNARSKIVRVTSKKIRVLYVESRPRWEYRFLRQAMQRDRRVQPTFLLQEADPETVLVSPGPLRGQDGLPPDDTGDTPPAFIRTFPDRRQDLFGYDVILFGDVNVAYLRDAHL